MKPRKLTIKFDVRNCAKYSSPRNTVSFVSGGASGLGFATVQRLAELGSKVVYCDLASSNESLEHLKKNIFFSPADVTSESDVKSALEFTINKFGKLDLAVNCAGTAIAYKTYNFNKRLPHCLEDFVKVMMVNAVGTFNVTRLASGLMGYNEKNLNGQRGVIINTSSTAAFDGTIGQVAYAASQGAVASMTLPLARELGTRGIRVMTIAPGLFRTRMTSELPEKVISFLSNTIPFPKRLGNPEEYAQLVQAIYENPILNGEVIRLDGALRMLQ